MSKFDEQARKCETCPFEIGCTNDDQLNYDRWVKISDGNPKAVKLYREQMLEKGIAVDCGNICISGLVENYPKAPVEWLVERAYLIHHETTSEIALRLVIDEL